MNEKITFSFFVDTRRLSEIHFNFAGMSFSLFNTKDFIYVYTILQVFLQGRLERKEKTFELTNLDSVTVEGNKIKLKFLRFADFVFEKRSENSKQYLLINITKHVALAKEEDQDWDKYDREKILEKYKEYLNKKIALILPEKPIRLTRFQAQYYFNVMQKISYSW